MTNTALEDTLISTVQVHKLFQTILSVSKRKILAVHIVLVKINAKMCLQNVIWKQISMVNGIVMK